MIAIQTERIRHTLKLTGVGNAVGVVLPEKLLTKHGVREGDTILAIDRPDGVRLTTGEPEFAPRMDVAQDMMKRWRNVLRDRILELHQRPTTAPRP